MTDGPMGGGRPDRWLALTSLAYALGHHLGSLPGGLGPAGHGTWVTDWLDLPLPVVVLAPALLTLVAAGAGRAAYAWFGVGAWLYVSGHGIHLAANSIGNASPSPTAHLWDEQVGHWIWYAGVAVLAATLATTMRGRPVPGHRAAWAIAVAAGATWGTNATGGELTWPGAAVAAVALAWGLRHRADQRVLLAPAGAAGLLAIVVSAVPR